MTANISTALVGAFDFDPDGMRVWNPAFTFQYTFQAAAIAANRTLNIPLITATDTLAVLGLAQTFTAAQTVSANLITQLVRPSASLTYNLGSNANKYNYAYIGLGLQINVNQFAFQISDTTGSGLFFNNTVGAKGFDWLISSSIEHKLWSGASADSGAFFHLPRTTDPTNATTNGTLYVKDDGAGNMTLMIRSGGAWVAV
jgi:hypothetical protein